MARCLNGVTPRALAVGCSGGPDSMALTGLLSDWARAEGVALTALIVNHGLRPDAADEARRVAGWLRGRGMAATILTWEGGVPTRNVQAEARRIRYTLISEWCRANGVPVVAVAHHRDDQAETFLLRLARGSGVDGLAAMPVRAALTGPEDGDSITLLRPLLEVGKQALARDLAARGWPSVQDPSNRDRGHARVRMRELSADLAAEGLDARRLAKTAAQMRRAREALETATDAFLATAATSDPLGFMTVRSAALQAEPREIALRALSRAVLRVGGRAYPARLDRLENCLDGLFDPAGPDTRTLAGCRLSRQGADIFVSREAAAVRETVPARPDVIWDRRLRLALSGDLAGLTVRKLGQGGMRQVRAMHGHAVLDAVPAPARFTLPALWRDDQLICAGGVGEAGVSGLPAVFESIEFLVPSAYLLDL